MFNFSWFAGLVDGLKPHPLPLCSQKNEMLLFWITLNFWWLARLSDGLKPHPPPLSSQKMKCSFLYYFELLMISQAGQWTQTPSASPLQPIKWNAYFWIMFNFWWSAGLVDGLKPSPPPISSLKSEMLIFWLCSARFFLLVSAVSGPFTSRLAVCISFSWFSRSEVCAFVLGNGCERCARRDLC